LPRLLLSLWVAMLFAAPSSVFAAEQGLTPAEAVSSAVELDGRVVVVEGEALGEALRAPDGMRWVNVLGGGTALGLVVTEKQAGAIPTFGAYRMRGATLRAEGVLNAACDVHGGDLDLHADTLEVLDEGEEIPHSIHPLKLVFIVPVLLGALLLGLRYRRLRKASKES
jgi:hypothetical protein